MTYNAMNSQVKKLESKIGISRRQKEEALGRLIDDIIAVESSPEEDTTSRFTGGSKEDLPVAIGLCEKYDIATKLAAALKDMR